MTDEAYLRDIEEAARALSALPDDYAVLRALLRSLPPGTAPSLREAAAGLLSEQAGAGGLGDQLSLQSALPPGSQSGGSVGILAELFYGRSNLLPDPAFAALARVDPIPVTTPAPSGLTRWQVHYLLNSGTAPSSRILEQGKTRFSTGNRSNSAEASLFISSIGAACDVTFLCRSVNDIGSFVPAPFLLASTRIVDPGALPGNLAGISSVTVTVEIVTAAGTVLAASTPMDWLAFMAATSQGDSRRTTAILQNPASSDAYWQLRVRIVTPGATASWIKVNFVEPQMTYSTSQQPPPFSPIVSSWITEAVLALKAGTGQVDPLRFGWDTLGFYSFTATNEGDMRWGPGPSPMDVRLRRSGAKELSVDDIAGGPVRMKHVGPHFVQGPNDMDLAITYGADGPTNVARNDEGVPVSSSVISYAAGKVASVVTTRFGKTITVTPAYTGDNITSVDRVVT